MFEPMEIMGFDLLYRIDNNIKELINPNIYSLLLINNYNNFFVEKNRFLDTYADINVYYKETLYLTKEFLDNFNLILDDRHHHFDFNDYNELILSISEKFKIFDDESSISTNFLEELKKKYPDMIDDKIYSVRTFHNNDKSLLIINKDFQGKGELVIYNLFEIADEIENFLLDENLESYVEFPNLINYDNAEFLQDLIINEVNKQLLVRFFGLFNIKTYASIIEEFDEYKKSEQNKYKVTYFGNEYDIRFLDL